MKNALVLAIVISFLAIPALAVPENITTGPYKISFDTGLPQEYYNITIGDPKREETLSGENITTYSIQLNTSDLERATIMIFYSEKETKPVLTAKEMEYVLSGLFIDKNLKNIDSAIREIDSVMGAIVSGVDEDNVKLKFNNQLDKVEIYYAKLYQANYIPSFDPNHTYIAIKSDLPWDEGTLQLLKTIHVEKVG